MTLFNAYLALGAALSVLGVALASGIPWVGGALRAFPRSLPATVVCLVGAAVWFLWLLSNLGESDLAGFPRTWLYGIFGGAVFLAFFVLPDLLAVRGFAVLLLLSARGLLDAGFMQLPYSFLLATVSYALVVLGIWWGASPYVFRNQLNWLLSEPVRARIAGGATAALGVACLVSAFVLPATPAHP